MKVKMTYGDLDILNQSIQRECQSPAFAFLLKEKIKNFHQRNAIRLKAMEEKFQELIKKHVLHNEKNESVTKRDEKGVLVYDFQDDESKNAYMQEIKDFCARMIEVEIWIPSS